MSKKNKKSRPLPRANRQIPHSSVRPFTTSSQSSLFEKAQEFPFYGCWIMEGWQDSGITPVVVARMQDDHLIMFGVYLVDHYCLGIKNVFTGLNYSRNRFERELPEFCINAPAACSVELAHELIYGALEYAKKLGFEPHPDFYRQKADLILDPPDMHPRENNIEFGSEGKPLYVSGPFDSEMKSRSVVDTLMRTCGEGNFHHLITFSDPTDET